MGDSAVLRRLDYIYLHTAKCYDILTVSDDCLAYVYCLTELTAVLKCGGLQQLLKFADCPHCIISRAA